MWVVTIPWGKAGIEKFLASTPMPGLTVVYVDIPHFPVRFLVGKYSAKALCTAYYGSVTC